MIKIGINATTTKPKTPAKTENKRHKICAKTENKKHDIFLIDSKIVPKMKPRKCNEQFALLEMLSNNLEMISLNPI